MKDARVQKKTEIGTEIKLNGNYDKNHPGNSSIKI